MLEPGNDINSLAPVLLDLESAKTAILNWVDDRSMGPNEVNALKIFVRGAWFNAAELKDFVSHACRVGGDAAGWVPRNTSAVKGCLQIAAY